MMIRDQFTQQRTTAYTVEEMNGDGTNNNNNINNSRLLGVHTTESTQVNALLRKQLDAANTSIKGLEGKRIRDVM